MPRNTYSRRNETFDVEGVQEVADALARMGDLERHQAMRAGFDEASAFVLRDMKQRAPRRKGDLANNLTRVVNVRAGKVTSADIGPRSKGKRDRWWSDLARWLEYGTRDSVKRVRPIGKRGFRALSAQAADGAHPVKSAKHVGIGAHPFMRPSIDNNVERIATIMLSAVRRAARITGFEVR